MIVAIVGVGQIGGSLAAAIKKRNLAQLVPIGRNDDLADVRMADLVVLSTPSRTIIDLIPKVVPMMRSKSLLTDVGSVKQQIVDTYRKHRRKDLTFVPGHPMAGTEDRDLRDPDLFVGKTWFTLGSDPRLEKILTAIGAEQTLLRDAKQHDALCAAISHLPHAIAAALYETGEEQADHSGSSFRDATRVLMSHPRMVADFMTLNRAALKESLKLFIRNLRRIAALNQKDLEELWGKARRKRGRLS